MGKGFTNQLENYTILQDMPDVERIPYLIEPKNWLRKPVLEFLHSFPGIEISDIGKLIGTGFYHDVYVYRTNWVLKIPRFFPGFPPYTAEERTQELEILERYFPSGSITETHVESSPNHPYYCFIQKRLDQFGFVEADDLGTQTLIEIIAGNRRLVENEHATFDFFGFYGVILALQSNFDKRIKPRLTNIIKIDKDGRTKFLITDTSLYFFKKQYDLPSSYKHTVAVSALEGNKILMKKYFGIDILPKFYRWE